LVVRKLETLSTRFIFFAELLTLNTELT